MKTINEKKLKSMFCEADIIDVVGKSTSVKHGKSLETKHLSYVFYVDERVCRSWESRVDYRDRNHKWTSLILSLLLEQYQEHL